MATTINSYSVSLGMEANGFINSSKLSRSEARQLTRDIDSAKTPAERFATATNRIEQAHRSGAIAAGVYNRLIDSERQKLDAATAAMKRHASATGQAGSATAALMSRAKSLAATYLGLQTAVSSIRLAAEAEQSAVQFEVLTGSITKANAIIADSKALAASSPITLTGAQQAYRTLISFGIAAEQTTETLRRLSDVTGGNEERFKMLTLAYAQASAAGRLQGQDLLQMINAGFNPLQERAQRTGQSLMELRDIMQDGGYSAQMMAEDFVTATSAGGRFEGMTDRLADTMGGRLAQAMSKLQETSIGLGQSLEVFVTTLTVGVNDGNSALQDMVYWIGKGADGISFMTTVTQDFLRANYMLRTNISGFLLGFDTGGLTPATDALLNRLDERDRKKQASARLEQDTAKQLQEDAQLRLELERGIAETATKASKLEERIQGLKEARDFERASFSERATNERELLAMRRAELAQELAAKQAAFALERQIPLVAKESQKEAESLMRSAASLKKQLTMDALRSEAAFRKEMVRLEENAAKLRLQTYTDALDAARKHFADENKRREKMRQDIASTGAGAGFEVGSAEAAKFTADQRNQLIANAVVGGDVQPTEKELLEEAKRQVVLAQQQQAKTDRMLQILERSLEVQQQNGFKRIR